MKIKTAIKLLKNDAEFLGMTDFAEYLKWTSNHIGTAPQNVRAALTVIEDCDMAVILNWHSQV